MEGQVNGKGGWRLSPGPGRGVGKACLVLASGPESPLPRPALACAVLTNW